MPSTGTADRARGAQMEREASVRLYGYAGIVGRLHPAALFALPFATVPGLYVGNCGVGYQHGRGFVVAIFVHQETP
jgi:hypothetical protein